MSDEKTTGEILDTALNSEKVVSENESVEEKAEDKSPEVSDTALYKDKTEGEEQVKEEAPKEEPPKEESKEEVTPEKKKKKKKKKKKETDPNEGVIYTAKPVSFARRHPGCMGCFTVFLIFILVLGGLGYAGYKIISDEYVGTDSTLAKIMIKLNIAKEAEEVEVNVDIPDGTSVNGIASRLDSSGIIDSQYHFMALCKLKKAGGDFKSGKYKLSNRMTFSEIAEELRKGGISPTAVKLTVKEGQWLKEIATDLSAKGLCTYDEFIAAASSRDYSYDFVADIPERANLLEGYLYPETYYIEPGTPAKDIVAMMLEQFDKNVDATLRESIKAKGKTLDDIVIAASVIEGEATLTEEKPLVASVIYNRIAQGMKLQMNDTVQYALGRKDRVMEADLLVQDSHNTYVCNGLPSGPVGNAGIESIKAAIEPAQTDYLYYVKAGANSFGHKFSSDYQQFLQDKDAYFEDKDS
ncbi:MAG: endolytic transglycosylase MltG [Firmicutes bacterium]|nr:endolytic transglycosylase MltG [Bacillota bacterium]